jgi:hypothetical protein
MTCQAVSWGPGRLDLFGLSPDGLVLHKAFNGQDWWPGVDQWNPIGDRTIHRPVAVSVKPNCLDVYAVGDDNHLWTKWWDGTAWGLGPGILDWMDLGGELKCEPAVASWGPDRVDLFALPLNGSGVLLHKCWSAQAGWWPSAEGWDPMWGPPVEIQTPVVVTRGPESLELVALGEDRHLWHKAFYSGTWLPSPDRWTQIANKPGLEMISTPACLPGAAGVTVYVTASDGTVWDVAWDAGNEHYLTDPLWLPKRGQFEGAPAVVSWGGKWNRDLFARSAANVPWHKYCREDQSDWKPSYEDWDRLGGEIIETPAAISWGPGRLDVFARGTDCMLYHLWWDGKDWGPDPYYRTWEFMGGPLAG